MPRRNRFAAGFTLVEVMVVVVIVMVLASMLLVGFTHAQKTAEAAYCMNNLRQVGTAIISYATLYGGGCLPDFSVSGDRRMRDQWVWQLDFIREDQRFLSRQEGVDGSTVTDKIIPPRMAPAVLCCPADVQLFVNHQSMLTSYWMHPENSYKILASITNQDETIMGWEGDALHKTRNCGCRFHTTRPPTELDTTHFGGGHILFVNGTVELYTDPVNRKLITWEKRAGWK